MPAAAARIAEADLAVCRRTLAQGSKSFAAASRLLPGRIRDAVCAMYAFCRVADDEVDQGGDLDAAVAGLYARLEAITAGRPANDPIDRAFAAVVAYHRLPAALPRALIEGFAWDAAGRRYRTLQELEAYCARVASTVGLMMTLLMGPRRPAVLARAGDLGLAMQLTNICRDVGQDARAGRIYLPLDWLQRAGCDPEQLLAAPRHSPALGGVVRRLLAEADRYYQRADRGISLLPRDCRLAIRSARLIYAAIGRRIRRNGCNAVDQRAFTSPAEKLWLIARAGDALLWPPRPHPAPARPAVQALIDAIEV
jgi:phytoene synthase